MGIGVSVFLLALGAILTFAVDATVGGLNIDVVGIILMIAGAIGIAVDLAVFAPRRRTVATDSYPAEERVVTRERRDVV